MNDLQRKDSSMKEQWNESTATAKGYMIRVSNMITAELVLW